MSELIAKIEEVIWGAPFILMMILSGVILTFKFKIPQIRTILSIGSFNTKKQSNDKITSFKALMTILAGTLGIGNITGVAGAISIGGIGSIFWMTLSAIFAMAISYAENLIVLANRKYNSKKGLVGGAMYVLDDVLDKRGLAIFFSLMTICTSLGMGAMVQSNSLTEVIHLNYNISKGIIAVFVVIIASYVVIGGKKRVAKFSSYIIPFCTIIYIVLCIAIILKSNNSILIVCKNIIREALGIRSVVGGLTGVTVMKTVSVGFSRGMFSNEAGMGTAPLFASNTEEDDVELQARIMATSVFIDTIFLCTLTALTIICADNYYSDNFFEIIRNTFSVVIGGNLILNICIFCFAIATLPCAEYYGERAMDYLFNGKYKKIYKLMFFICVYLGCLTTVNLVWNISSICNALMTIPNLIMIYLIIFRKKY